MRRTLSTLAVIGLMGALAACSSGGDSGGDSSGDASADTSSPPAATDDYAAPSDSPSTDAAAPPAAGDAVLATGDSALGTIVVDGTGLTAYYFDKDTADSGMSTCTDECAANWPAITTDSDAPQVDGVTGEIGTITGVDGGKQVTIDGRPVYTFAGDKAAGDVNGQGLMDLWYVIGADGSEMKDAAPTS